MVSWRFKNSVFSDVAKSRRDDWHFIPAFPYTLGGNSQARHKYQLATERQGFHRAARRSICSALGSISRVIGFPALTLPNVKRYPLRIP